MGFKAFILLGLASAILLIITSEVAARELAESSINYVKNTNELEKKNEVNDAKYRGRGYPGDGYGGYTGGGYEGYPGGAYGGYHGGGRGRGRESYGGNIAVMVAAAAAITMAAGGAATTKVKPWSLRLSLTTNSYGI